MKPTSWNAFLSSMLYVGQREYIETTATDYAHVMRTVNTPKSRRPKEMAGMKFSTTLWTAVGPKAGNIRYLVCVERIA